MHALAKLTTQFACKDYTELCFVIIFLTISSHPMIWIMIAQKGKLNSEGTGSINNFNKQHEFYLARNIHFCSHVKFINFNYLQKDIGTTSIARSAMLIF